MNKSAMKCLVCCMLIAGLMITNVFAGEINQVTPRFSHIQSTSIYVDIVGDEVKFGGAALPIYEDNKAYITVKLQKRSIDGGSWSSISTKTARGAFGTLVAASGTKSLEDDYEYRTYLLCVIFDSDGNALESHTMYSDIKRP